ncbi:MAG TPA: hypothetical protein VMB48_16065 [Steroidobacteraceae bacterium]|nr:hypothetical protein [Steroidobacteraceae bacterium]
MTRHFLTQKRVLAAILLAVLLGCAASYYLGWGLFGSADRKVLALVTLVAVIGAERYGLRIFGEIKEHRRRKGGT